LPEAVKLLGRSDTKVTVTFSVRRRPGQGFTLARAIIKMDMSRTSTQKGVPARDDKIGYVRITEFGDKAAKNSKPLEQTESGGMKALIIDLRGIPALAG